jgi:Flp pilus assembly protein CpaB
MKATLLLLVVSVLCHGVVYAQSNSPSALVIPDGMQAVDIGAAKMLWAGAGVKAGDHVDIFATYDERHGSQVVAATQMILQDILVLAANSSSNNAGRSSMTVAVKSEEAELVGAADRAGALRVALHPIHDEKTATPPRPGKGEPSQPRIGDFWLPGEYERLLEQKKRERGQKPN